MLVIAKKKKKKTKKIIYLVFGITAIASIGLILFLYNRPNIKLPTNLVNKELNNVDFTYENNTITFNFEDVDVLNKIINYTDSTSNIYIKTVDKIMKNDEKLKMYNQEDKKILETTMNKEQATKLFGNYVDNIENDTTIKVIFDGKSEDKDISAIDLKFN